MSPQVTVHPEAEAEILQTLAWYNERSRVAARAFVQELGHVIRLAAQAPKKLAKHFCWNEAGGVSTVPVRFNLSADTGGD